jgi:hypothetical protein
MVTVSSPPCFTGGERKPGETQTETNMTCQEKSNIFREVTQAPSFTRFMSPAPWSQSKEKGNATFFKTLGYLASWASTQIQ